MAKFNIVSKKTASTKALERLLNQTKQKDVIEYDPSKQASGIKERLEGSGLDAEKFSDNRNILEKALNLTPNQNFLFDVFELINRPQQAVFNAVKANQNNEDVAKAFTEGLSGKAEDVYFKEILNNAGITEDSGDAFGFDDVLGFAGDIFLDPVDLALIAAAPFTGGASAAVVFATNSLDAVGDLTKSINTLEGIIKTGKRSAGEVTKIKKLIAKKSKQLTKLQNNVQHYNGLKKAAENVLEVSKAGSKYDVKMAKKAYKQALKPLMIKKSPLDLAMRASKYSVKGSFKLADNAYTKILQKVDAQKIANGANFQNGFDIVNKEFSSVAKYTNFKDKVQAIFKASESIPKNLIKKLKGKGDLAKEQILILGDDVVKVVKELSQKTGKKESEISQILQDMVEYKLNPKITPREILNKPQKMMDKATTDKLYQVLKDNLVKADGTPYFKNQDEFWNLIEEVDLGDGVKGFRFKDGVAGEGSQLLQDIDNIAKEQTEAYKAIEKQVQNINKKIDAANAVDETTYDIVDGKIVWSNADDVARKKADELIDADIAKRHLSEDGVLNRNEDIKKAAIAQQAKLNNKLKKTTDPEQIKVIKKRKAELQKLINKIDKDVNKLNNVLDPKLNPQNYTDEAVERLKSSQRTMEGQLDVELDGPRFYSQEEIKNIEAYNNDPALLAAAQQVEGQMNRMYTILDDVLGTNFVSRGDAGYVRHTATAEAQRFFAEDLVEGNAKLKGRTSSFKYREYRMSAKEANRLWKETLDRSIALADPATAAKLEKYRGTKLFEEQLTKSVADFVQEAGDIGAVSKIFDELAVRGTFEDPNLFQVKNGETLRGARQRVVSKKTLLDKLKKLRDYRGSTTSLDEAIKYIEETLKDASNFYMDNTLLDLIGVATDPEVGNIFLSVVNGLNNVFKKLSLATPGFHMRNVIGNYTNMFLAGVNMKKLNPYIEEAYQTLVKGKDVLAKVARNGEDSLTVAEKLIYKDYQQFIQSGFHDIAYELYDLPKIAGKKMGKNQKQNVINKALQANMDLNKYMDNMFRMSLLKYANDNPSVYLKMGAGSPEDYVRMVLFDPNDLTVAEKKWLRSMIPFYTFMKKNLSFQMKNVFENPTKYNQVNKAIKSAWNNIGTDRDEIEAYKKENFWIPILKKENGEYITLKANLPIGDLGEFVSNPLQKIISSVTPAVRAPFEITANTQTYTGLPIQEFKGQQGFRIPQLSRGVEYGLSQFGLLNPLGAISDIVNPEARKQAGAENFFNAVGFTSTGDAAREERNRAFQELERLRGAVSYYKQQGSEIKTLDEIREDVALNKTTTAQILSRLQSTLK